MSKNGLNFENFHFLLERVSPRENVSIRVCPKCVTSGMSTVHYVYSKLDHKQHMYTWIASLRNTKRETSERFQSFGHLTNNI